jgi:hypothetical protein
MAAIWEPDVHPTAAEVPTLRRKAKAARGPYLLHVELLRDRVPSFDQFPYCLPAIRGLDRSPLLAVLHDYPGFPSSAGMSKTWTDWSFSESPLSG